jgi:hypothetical protein
MFTCCNFCQNTVGCLWYWKKTKYQYRKNTDDIDITN